MIFFRSLRFLAGSLGFVQRLPFFLLTAPAFFLLLLGARIRWVHRLFYLYLKSCSGLFLWLNGVKLTVDKSQLHTLAPGFFLVNFSTFTDLLLLLRVLPYQKLMVLDPSLFGSGWVRYAMSVSGICPAHTPLSVETVFKDHFYYEDYVEHSFSIVELSYMEHQTDQVIPNVMALSLRYKKPLHCLRLTYSKPIVSAHFLSPVTVTLALLETVPVNRRPELSLLNYDHVKYQYERSHEAV